MKVFRRLNHQIRVPQVRVIDDQGEQLGVISTQEALRLAQERGVDLVEVAPNANPPVCRLVDYNKFLYQEEKKARETKRGSKGGDVKEIRLSPFISENDFTIRVKRAEEFMGEGHKLRVVLKFSGREMAHPEFGWTQINKFIEAVSEFGKVEREPKQEGKMLVTTLTPAKKGQKQNEQTENT